MKCKLCDGSGEKIVQVIHPLSKRKKLASELCLCSKSRIVSTLPSYKLVTYLDDIYLPPENLDPNLKFEYPDVAQNPNLLIHASNYDTFCLHLKTFLMLNRFVDPTPSIYCCHAIDIVHDFLVPQDDGKSPHLSSTDQFHLFVFSMDTAEKNDGLTTSVAQVVYKRKMIRRPTWIYQPSASLEACKEYTPELKEYLKTFKKITLKDVGVRKNKVTASQNNAANYNPT